MIDFKPSDIRPWARSFLPFLATFNHSESEGVKFARSTRNAYLAKLIAKKLVEEVDGGAVIAAEALFDV